MKLKDRWNYHKNIFQVLVLSVVYLGVLIVILPSSLEVLRELIVNLLASTIVIFFTVFLLDYYFEQKREQEWKNVKSLILSELDNIIGKVISAYILFFNFVPHTLTGINDYKNQQSIIFKTKVIPSLNNNFNPSIYNYSMLRNNFLIIQEELTLYISSYLSYLHPDVIQPLILAKDMINMLNNDLSQLDYSHISNNSAISYKLIDSFLSINKEFIVHLSSALNTQNKDSKLDLYNII